MVSNTKLHTWSIITPLTGLTLDQDVQILALDSLQWRQSLSPPTLHRHDRLSTGLRLEENWPTATFLFILSSISTNYQGHWQTACLGLNKRSSISSHRTLCYHTYFFFFFTVLEEYGSRSSSRHSWKFLKNQSSKKIIRTMVIKNQYLK